MLEGKTTVIKYVLALAFLTFVCVYGWLFWGTTIVHNIQLSLQNKGMVPTVVIQLKKPWKRSRLLGQYKKFYPYCCYHNHQPTKWIPLHQFLMDEDIVIFGLILSILSIVTIMLWKRLIKEYIAFTS